MTVRHRLIPLAFAGALACASAQAAADELSDGVKAIPGTVEIVEIGGTWARGGIAGQYRIIVTRTGGDRVSARLFVQWLAYQEDGSAIVTDTIEINEFAELDVDVAALSPNSDDGGLEVFIETLDPNGREDKTFELFVISPTDYRFGPASN